MTNAVISAVEAMAEKEGQQLSKGGVPLLEWRPNASVEEFLEEDVKSADEYENVVGDNFDPTETDNDVVEEPDHYNDIEPFDNDDVGFPDDDDVGAPDEDKVADPAVFEPDPDVMNLIPTPTKAPRQTTIPETKIPEAMLPTQTWSLTQTKIWVPTGTILGATEGDPTVTDSITKWMTP